MMRPQDALVRAWRDLPTLRDVERFDAWLYRLIVNACTTSPVTAGACGPRSSSTAVVSSRIQGFEGSRHTPFHCG
jgi:hypothetical protein